jgi:hypothetical protein
LLKRRAIPQTFCCDAVVHIRGCLTPEEFHPLGKFPDPGARCVSSHSGCIAWLLRDQCRAICRIEEANEQPALTAGRQSVSG